MLRKLAAYRGQNRLDLALQELGRSNARCSCSTGSKARNCADAAMPIHNAGLNKSEQRHFLAQVICTFKQGQIADRSA
jgi:TnpA family transposase